MGAKWTEREERKNSWSWLRAAKENPREGRQVWLHNHHKHISHTGDIITAGLEPGVGALVLVDGGGGIQQRRDAEWSSWGELKALDEDYLLSKKQHGIWLSEETEKMRAGVCCVMTLTLLTILLFSGGRNFFLSLHSHHQLTPRIAHRCPSCRCKQWWPSVSSGIFKEEREERAEHLKAKQGSFQSGKEEVLLITVCEYTAFT